MSLGGISALPGHPLMTSCVSPDPAGGGPAPRPAWPVPPTPRGLITVPGLRVAPGQGESKTPLPGTTLTPRPPPPAPKFIKMFVLDEADEMLSRGFKDQIYDIFQKLSGNTQVGGTQGARGGGGGVAGAPWPCPPSWEGAMLPFLPPQAGPLPSPRAEPRAGLGGLWCAGGWIWGSHTGFRGSLWNLMKDLGGGVVMGRGTSGVSGQAGDVTGAPESVYGRGVGGFPTSGER